MSMNLIFDVKNSSGIVDFPFQTPTELTYAVLRAKTKKKRLELLQEYVEKRFDEEHGKEIMEDIKSLMNSNGLELSLI